jgi:hypothetical protein
VLAHGKQKGHFRAVSTPLSEYHVNLRMALSDMGANGIYKYKNEALNGALQSVVEMGKGPKGVVLTNDKTAFDPAPATPDARGFLVFNAALLLVGGMIPVSIRTRAMQTRVDSIERMTTIDYLRRQILALETSGDPHGTGGSRCFGVWNDLENALDRTTEPVREV